MRKRKSREVFEFHWSKYRWLGYDFLAYTANPVLLFQINKRFLISSSEFLRAAT